MPKKDTKLQKLSENIYIVVEEMRRLGIEELDKIFMEEYLRQADQLTDTRQQAKVWHPLKDILGIVFLPSWPATMNGQKPRILQWMNRKP